MFKKIIDLVKACLGRESNFLTEAEVNDATAHFKQWKMCCRKFARRFQA